jgi:hypothetical protein
MNIELKLKAEEIDTVLGALGDQPFIKVAELINKIRTQAVPQFEKLQKEAVDSKAE